MKFYYIIFILIISPLYFSQAFQDSTNVDMEFSLDELMNTKVKVSSFNAKTVFNTPSSVCVINSEEISKYGFQTVQEAVRMRSGIDVYYTVLDQNVVTSRGILQNFYANKVLVLINGISTWQPIYGNANIERININDVERIEILKGPASVLYGTNAYTGVINIVLHDNKAHLAFNNDFNAHIKVNRPKGGEAGANIMFKIDNFEFFSSLNAGIEKNNPYKVQSKSGSSIFTTDKYDSLYNYTQLNNYYNFNLNVLYGNHSLNINDYVYEHTFPGIDPSYKQGGSNLFNDNGLLISYIFEDKYLDEKFKIKATASYDYFERYYPDSYDRVTELFLSGSRFSGTFKSDYLLNENLSFELGTDFDERISGGHKTINVLKDSIVRSNLKNDKNIYEWSGYLQTNLTFSDFSLLGGIRFTQNQISGNDVSSRFTCVYSINEKSSLKLIFAQSFRSPQMLELYFDHPTVVGNPELKPEKCNSYELAYLVGSYHLFIESILYYSSYSNLIQRITPVTGPPSVYRNLGKFDSYGLETSIKYNSRIINAFLDYNYMAGVGTESEENFKYVPKHTIRYGLNKNLDPFFISCNGYTCSKVMGNFAEINMQSFLNLAFGLTHRIEGSNTLITHTLNCNNIFDADMLTPEYIRKTPNINALASMGFGRTFSYSIKFNI